MIYEAFLFMGYTLLGSQNKFVEDYDRAIENK